MSESDFAGRHVLITGGTRGIGKSLAVMLAAEGARLSLNYVSRAEDAAAADESAEAEEAPADIAEQAGADEGRAKDE